MSQKLNFDVLLVFCEVELKKCGYFSCSTIGNPRATDRQSFGRFAACRSEAYPGCRRVIIIDRASSYVCMISSEDLSENLRFFNKFSTPNRFPVVAGGRFSQISVYFFGIRISLRNFALRNF